MIRSGHALRMTATEVEDFQRIGLDFSSAKCGEDIGQEVSRWAHTLADERFELLQKIAAALSEAKGVRLSARLSAVTGEGSPR